MGYIKEKTKDGQKTTYEYDDFYHLSAVGSALNEFKEAYSYDKSGNRLQDTINNTNYVYEDDKLVSTVDENYIYNDEGDLIEIKQPKSSMRFSYDSAFNMTGVDLNGASLQKNSYDHAGRRIRKTVNGVATYLLYDERGLLAEYDGTGKLIQGYSYLPMDNFSISPVLTYTKSGANVDYFFYHNDIAQTPQIITNMSGEVVWSANYKSFGEAVVTTEKIKNKGLS